MHQLPTTLVLAACLFAIEAETAETRSTPYSTPSDFRSHLGRPSNFGIQVRAMKDGPAAGADLVLPVFGTARTLLLGQAYAFKGDAELGGFGAGLILRHRLARTRMVEANAFLEGLRDREGFSYPQVGVGFAYSESWFTARVNGYIPLRGGDDRRIGSRTWTERTRGLDGSVVAVDWTQDVFEHRSPGLGFDAEIEFRLPQPPRWLDPHLVVGYFYREADDRSAVHSGMLVRGELHFGENWAMEGEWRDDAAEIGQEFRFVIRYQKLFGGEEAVRPPSVGVESTWMDRAMHAPAEREPWPTVTRSSDAWKPRITGSRLLSEPEPETPPLPDDCCPTPDDPLIFD